jgi:hypothetical protein
MSENEKLSLATRLYVRLRLNKGRVVDVLWMLRNQDYAREILKIARSLHDNEAAELADRYEVLMTGTARAPMSARA